MNPLLATDVAEHVLWLRSKDKEPTDPLQLNKLVYLCHGWMLGLFREPLIEEGFKAWDTGPMSVSVYDQYAKWGDGVIKSKGREGKHFSDKQRDIVQAVEDRYRDCTAEELSEATHHAGSPWEYTQKVAGRFQLIPDALIAHHFDYLYKNQEEEKKRLPRLRT